MKRRKFVESIVLTSAVSASGLLISCDPSAGTKTPLSKGNLKMGSGVAGNGEVPDWVTSMKDSDMVGLGPDGKPDPNYVATGTGHARTDVDPSKPHQMTLTKEEQEILDGKKGPLLQKAMKTVVAYGDLFGAEKLVDLDHAPHIAKNNYVPPHLVSLYFRAE